MDSVSDKECNAVCSVERSLLVSSQNEEKSLNENLGVRERLCLLKSQITSKFFYFNFLFSNECYFECM